MTLLLQYHLPWNTDSPGFNQRQASFWLSQLPQVRCQWQPQPWSTRWNEEFRQMDDSVFWALSSFFFFFFFFLFGIQCSRSIEHTSFSNIQPSEQWRVPFEAFTRPVQYLYRGIICAKNVCISFWKAQIKELFASLEQCPRRAKRDFPLIIRPCFAHFTKEVMKII